MSVRFDRPSKNLKTSVKSQRSNCALLIHRWEDANISKIEQLNIHSEKLLINGERSSSENLNLRKLLLIDNDVVNCTIEKNKSGSSGSFSAILKQGQQEEGSKALGIKIDYLQAINPGDWIMIYLKKSGKINVNSIHDDSGLKFLGIIENVRLIETDDPNKGSPTLQYIISGRDFGKVFDTSLYFNPVINKEQFMETFMAVESMRDASKYIKSDKEKKSAASALVTADSLFKGMVDFYLGGGLNKFSTSNQRWFIPRSLAVRFKDSTTFTNKEAPSVFDILDKSKIGLQDYKNGKLVAVKPLLGRTVFLNLPANGTIWSCLEYVANKSVNEMYTELTKTSSGNLQPSIVLRQVPFSNKGKILSSESSDDVDVEKTYFEDLPRLNIQLSDIKQKNIGKSDLERINGLVVVPRIIVEDFPQGYVVAYNIPSIQRYGLKMMQVQTQYTFGSSGEKDNTSVTALCKKHLNLIKDWFFKAHALYSGTIVLDGADKHIEVGQNLFIEDINQLFHIEAYKHTYEQNAATGSIQYNTELTLTRGQHFNKTSKFIDSSGVRSITVSTINLENVRNT